ncbi:hypothetical protein Q9966_004411 [Columba livia]|nr:hypothetical protein Q9966_004411 [Columba livia]
MADTYLCLSEKEVVVQIVDCGSQTTKARQGVQRRDREDLASPCTEFLMHMSWPEQQNYPGSYSSVTENAVHHIIERAKQKCQRTTLNNAWSLRVNVSYEQAGGKGLMELTLSIIHRFQVWIRRDGPAVDGILEGFNSRAAELDTAQTDSEGKVLGG